MWAAMASRASTPHTNHAALRAAGRVGAGAL